MDWQTLLNRERLGKPHHSPEELGRSPFHKDHDRIIFSGAFRRLGRKTQVHPVNSNDHIHTRLTHSLEVSCVGRSLGMRVGETIRSALPQWCDPADLGMVVQSACLACSGLARGLDHHLDQRYQAGGQPDPARRTFRVFAFGASARQEPEQGDNPHTP